MQPGFCPWLFAPFRSGRAAAGSEHAQCPSALPRSQPGSPGIARRGWMPTTTTVNRLTAFSLRHPTVFQGAEELR
jgi:hypothetical protein